MDKKFFMWFSISAIVWFIIIGIFKGNFEWDNLATVLVGGFVGIAVASFLKNKSNKNKPS
ncbi:hypothetical protein [Neobacillus sp. Marseille-QA0830]